MRDERDWRDFRRIFGKLPKTIFSVQDEVPTRPSGSDHNIGLESMSEMDDLDLDDDKEGIEVQGREKRRNMNSCSKRDQDSGV
ncbi:hypothetical protein D9613_010229 [Agrocybe pediades]|uniref:Uncharacterized protein n=1 Tax=Agrocybe pediades TaxID=84607 RepID=A0A8H4VHX3_9AGAR|nr:hypothetical protein D9613_010229 [Agrocybe pediades]